MATLSFFKYQGAGNDFIIIDNRNLQFKYNDVSLVAKLCDRRFGIGGDGLMLLQDAEDADFEMLYYNADGKPGSMCGNGGRCIVAFAKKIGLIDRQANFSAIDGSHFATLNRAGDWVSLGMKDVIAVQRDGKDYVLDTGSPHYVKVIDELEKLDVYSLGKAIRNHDAYAENGINVNFVQAENEGYFVRTYERGVENETLACGTGVTAVALAMADAHSLTGEISMPIRVLGGMLTVRFNAEPQKFTNIFLEGPATFVFEGTISL